MSQTGLTAFDTTLHVTNAWLKELMEESGWEDRQRAYHVFREVLHALRDRLPVGEVAALGAQLPLLVRGIYYEGWHPADKPVKHHKDKFLAHLADTLGFGSPSTAEDVVRGVFAVVARHVSHGEIESLKRSLPADLRSLWPD